MAPMWVRELSFALVVAASGCHAREELVVVQAASLARALGEVGDAFARENPGVRIRADVGGSQVQARKVADLGLAADVVALADADVIERLLVPARAGWVVQFATSSLVLAHLAHSRFTDEVTTANWPDVLTRPGVRLGLADPDLAPIGYRTLLAWQLAGRRRGRADLESALAAHVAPEHRVADEGALWALLPSRAVDYVFVYRSTAEDHRLKTTALADEESLGRPELASLYASASVPVRMRRDAPPVAVQGAPLWFGVTIPRDAPHPELARRWVSFLLSKVADAPLLRAGFQPLRPARVVHAEALPPELAGLVAP
jgi:molybdate/tungstate transport system substrate-binding protein